jgi:tight adherence protein B
MTTSTTVFAVLGAGSGAGAWLCIRGWRAAPARRAWRVWRLGLLRREGGSWRVPVAAGAGVAGGVVTGWVVGAVLVALAVWSLPKLLTGDRVRARQVAWIEAIASWAEMLRDTLAAAAGVEQAILASATVAPAAIHTEVTALAVRLETGHRLAPSLRQLADELADPTADLVISALLLASTQQARHVSDLLGSLATAAREQASMRLRIEAGRARSRTSVRIIVATTTGFAALLVVLNRDYLTAYDTLTGQLVLGVIGALFAVGFAALATIAAMPEPTRVLGPPRAGTAGRGGDPA